MSKWIVQLDYEFGEFEPNSIYFRRVCSDDIEYSSAYDTKREALEAFCVGQVAMDELRKEMEKEQHKINPCEPQTNREDMDFDTGQSYTWEQKEEQKPFEFCSDNRFEIIEKNIWFVDFNDGIVREQANGIIPPRIEPHLCGLYSTETEAYKALAKYYLEKYYETRRKVEEKK